VKDGIKQKFDFFGYAGNDDMNYAEMIDLEGLLDINHFRHQLYIF